MFIDVHLARNIYEFIPILICVVFENGVRQAYIIYHRY